VVETGSRGPARGVNHSTLFLTFSSPEHVRDFFFLAHSPLVRFLLSLLCFIFFSFSPVFCETVLLLVALVLPILCSVSLILFSLVVFVSY
jgi:hypothetical protein